MISYGKQSFDKFYIDSFVEVLKSDLLTQGPLVEGVEKNLKIFLDQSSPIQFAMIKLDYVLPLIH